MEQYKIGQTIKKLLMETGKTQNTLATYLGLYPAHLSKKIKNNTFTALEYIKIGHFFGIDLTLKRNKLNRLYHNFTPDQTPLRRIIDNEIYDTALSQTICFSPLKDGYFRALYVNQNDKYFIIFFTSWQSDIPRTLINPCSREYAIKFFSEYTQNPEDLQTFFPPKNKKNKRNLKEKKPPI